jgi:glucose/arabinose dehydrogenase
MTSFRPSILGMFLSVSAIVALAPAASAQTTNFQLTLDNNSFVSYVLTSVSSEKVFAGALPAENPKLILIVGKRYSIQVVHASSHPLQVVAQGTTASSDVVLLAQGGTTGSLESDASVAWTDVGGTVSFTVTTALASALKASGLAPGYRCEIHPSTMRGTFVIYGDGAPLENPIPRRVPKGPLAVELAETAGGFAAPLGLLASNDGSKRLFVYDQVGRVWIIKDGKRLARPFLDVRARLVKLNPAYDERGLLGLALHPDFATNGKLYTFTSEPAGPKADFTTTMPAGEAFNCQSVLAEWTANASNPDLVDKASRREILRIDKPQFNHNGGQLAFGSDRFLYISVGDGGAADDQGSGHAADGNSQSLDLVYGKILRIDVKGTNAANGKYGIPPANPFANKPGLDEIYAYGFRNPWAFSVDRKTGKIYVGDVGQNDIEEVDILAKGGNFGWRLKEGSFYFNPNGDGEGYVMATPAEPLPTGLLNPVAQYDHDDGKSVIGGYVYRGSAVHKLAGRYVFGDFGTSFTTPSGRLFYLDASNVVRELKIGAAGRPLGLWLRGFGTDTKGEIYVLGSALLGPSGATGKVYKIVPVL